MRRATCRGRPPRPGDVSWARTPVPFAFRIATGSPESCAISWVEKCIPTLLPATPSTGRAAGPSAGGRARRRPRCAALFPRHLLWVPNRNLVLGDPGPAGQCPGVGVLGGAVNWGGRAGEGTRGAAALLSREGRAAPGSERSQPGC